MRTKTTSRSSWPWRELHALGQLDAIQASHFAEQRPEEELYDVTRDPFEIRNLASDPEYFETLARLRERLEAWITETGDHGQEPESQEVFESDMAAYVKGIRKRDPERAREIEANIELMRKWAREGR